ncbi:DMT family transporter [Halomicrobium sp. HM KBTZ05]|uniref:EamA family transporter n=1 Tax=Halomicrobium mukohataei TaxID=57705 RepID=A0A847TXA7_9EURY|nr:EamA family transporter [Halomicrobium mukohataei]NLV10652.1 EamA family transporter [Halomicrobium mukohataei]
MSTRRETLLFVLLAMLWGTSFVAIKAGLEDLPPVLFAAIRYDLAGVLMLAYAAVATDDWLPRSRADWVAVAISATLVIALYNAFLFVGEQDVTSAVAAILIATNPILATAFSRALLPNERLSTVGTAGLVLGFVGVVLVTRPDVTGGLSAELVASGFVLLAALSIALGSVLLQRVDSGLGTEGLVAWSNGVGAVLLHAISRALPNESLGGMTLTAESVVAIVYLAVFASVIGYFVYFRLLDRLGAIQINLVSYATPVFAAVTGWLLLEETIDATTVTGFLVVLVGFLLLKRDAIREELAALR